MKAIREIQKIYCEELPMLEEKLFALSNQIHAEIETLMKAEEQNVQASLIHNFMQRLEPGLKQLIHKDVTFILPYIKKIVELFEQGDVASAYQHYQNLKKPVADLIKSQNEVMDQLSRLRQETRNFNLFFVRDARLKKLIIHLFNLYQCFEKYLFTEENLLLTALVHLTEGANAENPEIVKTL